MNYETFNQFCNALPETTFVVQWRGAQVWKIGGKVFAIGGLGADKKTTFTFKTSDNNFEFLKASEGYIPAPYFATRGMKWIQHIADNDDLDEDLHYYLAESYRLVSLGLTKSQQKELGLNQT